MGGPTQHRLALNANDVVVVDAQLIIENPAPADETSSPRRNGVGPIVSNKAKREAIVWVNKDAQKLAPHQR